MACTQGNAVNLRLLLTLLVSLAAWAVAQPTEPVAPLALPSYRTTSQTHLTDYALAGPVASVEASRFRTDPISGERLEPAELLSGGPGVPTINSLRLEFDTRGRLLRHVRMDATSFEWSRTELVYDLQGAFTGYEERFVSWSSGKRWWYLGQFVLRTSEVAEFVIDPSALGRPAHVRWHYDDQGRVTEQLTLNASGVVNYRRWYAYQGDWVVLEGEQYPLQSVRSEPQQVRYALTYADVDGLQVVASKRKYGENRLLSITDYWYHPNGSMAGSEYREYGNSRDPDAVRPVTRRERRTYDERGRLLTDVMADSRIVRRSEERFYQGAQLLGVDRRRHFSSDAWLRRCHYLGHDQYGNWTEERCDQQVVEATGQPPSFYEPATVELRRFTYHE